MADIPSCMCIGQGPYYGQAGHFLWREPNKVSSPLPPPESVPCLPADTPLQYDSAITRYIDEIRRVLSVLEKELTDNNKEWLVGGRISYADLAFVVWNWLLQRVPQLQDWREEFPRVAEWDRKLNERPSVAECAAQRTAAMKEGNV